MNTNLGDVVIPGSARVGSLDSYKGLAILLVVVGHLAQSGTNQPDGNLLFKGIYMFHMPLFFFISGMVYAVKPASLGGRDFLQSVLARTRQLLLPFFSWYVVSYWLSHSSEPMGGYFLELLKSPDSGLWFLWVLFVFSVVADIGRFGASNAGIPLWLTGAVAWVVFFHLKIHYYVLGLGLIAFHMPFFLVGIFHKEIVQAAGRAKPLLLTGCSIAFPIAVCVWDRLNPPQIGLTLQQAYGLPMSTLYYTFYLMVGYAYQAAFSIVGLVVFFIGARAFSSSGGAKPWIVRTLSFVGQRTLEVYALHFYFIQFRYSDASAFVNGLLAVVMVTSLSVFVADYLLKPNRVAALLLFGKTR